MPLPSEFEPIIHPVLSPWFLGPISDVRQPFAPHRCRITRSILAFIKVGRVRVTTLTGQFLADSDSGIIYGFQKDPDCLIKPYEVLIRE